MTAVSNNTITTATSNSGTVKPRLLTVGLDEMGDAVFNGLKEFVHRERILVVQTSAYQSTTSWPSRVARAVQILVSISFEMKRTLPSTSSK